MPADKVCIGAVGGVRGLKGEIRVKSFTADANDIAAYGPVSIEGKEGEFQIRVTGQVKGMVIARIDGIDDRDGAEALKGKQLYVPKSALPEAEDGEFYYADLMGMKAESTEGKPLGIVKAIHNFGAGDIIEIARETNGPAEDGDAKDDLMVPFTKAMVPQVDMQQGRIVIDPPQNLEPEDDPENDKED